MNITRLPDEFQGTLHQELFKHRRTQRDIDIMREAGISPQAAVNAGGLGVADVSFGEAVTAR